MNNISNSTSYVYNTIDCSSYVSNSSYNTIEYSTNQTIDKILRTLTRVLPNIILNCDEDLKELVYGDIETLEKFLKTFGYTKEEKKIEKEHIDSELFEI